MTELDLRCHLDEATDALHRIGSRLAEATIEENPALALVLAVSFRQQEQLVARLRRALVVVTAG